jgi:hypothetical protein
VGVREACGVGVSEPLGEVGVSVVDAGAVFALEELNQVILDDRDLAHGSVLRASRFTSDAITKCENVLVLVVLESVSVDINATGSVTQSCFAEPLVGRALRVNVGLGKVLLDHLACINVSENGDLLVDLVEFNFEHFPSEHHINLALVAFVQGDLIGIWESVDELVGSPDLDFSVGRVPSMHGVLSHEMLVIEGHEVTAFTLVWHCGRVADHVAMVVVDTMPVVPVNSVFVINGVNENLV